MTALVIAAPVTPVATVPANECGCSACEQGLEPLTVEHFQVWARELELDNGEMWEVDEWFLGCLEDYFAGTPENWWVVPEGNAKTTNTGGLALYLLEHRKGASIPWAASTREQAEIGYRQAEGFVITCPRLMEKFVCQEGYRRIKFKDKSIPGRIQVFAADDAHADGIIPTDAFLDELHRHKNLRLYRTWRGKLLKRGGQMATITTAGEPGSDFEDTRDRIRQETPVIEYRPGYIHCRSEQISLHEYSLEEGAEPDDYEAVKRANPFSGISIEDLRKKHVTPTMTPQHWARFVCNVPTRSVAAAIQEREWMLAEVDDRIPEGTDVWLGVDFGWQWDTTAIVPLWWREHDFRLLGHATVIVPPRDGSNANPGEFKRALEEYLSRYRVTTVVADISHDAVLAEWMSDELGLMVIDRAQTSKPQGEDYARFMEALRNGWLRHTGDINLKRHALNAISYLLPDGGARFKRPSETRIGGNQDARVIDALVAAAMVHSYAVEVKGIDDSPMVSFT